LLRPLLCVPVGAPRSTDWRYSFARAPSTSARTPLSIGPPTSSPRVQPNGESRTNGIRDCAEIVPSAARASPGSVARQWGPPHPVAVRHRRAHAERRATDRRSAARRARQRDARCASSARDTRWPCAR
jgi:hypothetical protein